MEYFALDVPETLSESDLRNLFPMAEVIQIRKQTWYIRIRNRTFEEPDSKGKFQLVSKRTITDPQLANLLVEGISGQAEVRSLFSPYGKIESILQHSSKIWRVKYENFRSGLTALKKFNGQETPKVTTFPRPAMLILDGIRDSDPLSLFHFFKRFGGLISMRYAGTYCWNIWYTDFGQAKEAARSVEDGSFSKSPSKPITDAFLAKMRAPRARVILIPPSTDASVELTEGVYRVSEKGALLLTFTRRGTYIDEKNVEHSIDAEFVVPVFESEPESQ